VRRLPTITRVIALTGAFAMVVQGGAPAQTDTAGSRDDSTSLERGIDYLRRTVEDAGEKDVWDKLNAVSALASGVLVAIIGAVATATTTGVTKRDKKPNAGVS
jgi:hypothetical protein